MKKDTMKKVMMMGWVAMAALSGGAHAAPGDTKVARWKDDRQAAVLLMYDDGWPSHWQVAIPEMAKRGLTGTFYIVPEKGEYKKFEQRWFEDVKKTGVVMAVHTMTHKGVKDAAHGEYEIGECANYIRRYTAKPKPELLSYGQPGVGPGNWNITKEETEALLKKYKLIDRPPFKGRGVMYHLKTKEEILALVDKAVEAKGMEYFIWHGVERIEPKWGYQDMWAMKQDVLLPLFDGLKERQDDGRIWVTDHISQHKYEVQRDAAEAKATKVVPRGIEIDLKCAADPELYDGPLTLITEVPADWKAVTIIQNGQESQAQAKDGFVKFDALPGTVRLVSK